MHSYAKNVLLLVASMLFSIGIAEGFLRFAGYSHLMPSQRDSTLGWSLQPDVEGWVDGEARVFFKTNSWGMRDIEHEVRKAPGVVRIAVLGDSFAEGNSVPVELSFPRVMARELARRKAFGGAPVEVLNFGVSGYSSTQEYLQLKSRVARFNPDIVLLAFYQGNDLRENSADFLKRWSPARPFYKITGGSMTLDTSFLASPPFSQPFGMTLRDVARGSNSRLAEALMNLRRYIQGPGPVPPVTEHFNVATGKDDSIFIEPRTESWEKAWGVTESLIDSMNRETMAHKARFAVATLTDYEQVIPDSIARRALESRLGVPDLFYPEHRIRQICGHRGIPIITLAPAMQAYAESCHVYLHGFPAMGIGIGHWNEKGHELAGSLLAEFLASQFGMPR